MNSSTKESNKESPGRDKHLANGDCAKQESTTPGQKMGHLKDLKHRALCELALWSHPAWIQPRPHSMYTTAAMQWVAYHRTRTAAGKTTVAEIIGGVRGVIPQSRLAMYGEFRYDIDYEDLFIDVGKTEDDWKQTKTYSNHNTLGSKDHENYLGVTADEICYIDQLYEAFTRKSTTRTVHVNKALKEWLKKVKDVLVAVKGIATFYSVFHSRTDALLKTCLKFLSDAQRNHEVSRLMEIDLAFVELYDELLREQVPKIELHSIPHPVLDKRSPLDAESEDGLWLRLTSMDVRRLWRENTRAVYPNELEYNFLSEQYPLIWLNFLRRQRGNCDFPAPKGVPEGAGHFDFESQSSGAEATKVTEQDHSAAHPDVDLSDTEDIDIEIPQFMEGEFLVGSLLKSLDESEDVEVNKTLLYAGGDSAWNRNRCLQQAHGEWTKNPLPSRQPVRPVPAEVASRLPGKPETTSDRPMVAGGTPLKFYPAPPMSPSRVLPAPGPPYPYCQPWRKLPGIPRNSLLSCRPQQRQQFIVPRVPVGCVIPVGPPISLPSPSYANALAQRREASHLLHVHQSLRFNSPKAPTAQEPTRSEAGSVSEIPLPASSGGSQTPHSESPPNADDNSRESRKSDSTTSTPSKIADGTTSMPSNIADGTTSMPSKIADGTTSMPSKITDRTTSTPSKIADRPRCSLQSARFQQVGPFFSMAGRPLSGLHMLAPVRRAMNVQGAKVNPRSFRLSVSQYLENNFQRYRMLGLPPAVAAAPKTALPPLGEASSVGYEDKVRQWLESNEAYLTTKPDDEDDVFATDKAGGCLFGGHLQRSRSHKRKKTECLLLPRNSLAKLKRGNSLEDRIKLLRTVFAEARLEDLTTSTSESTGKAARKRDLKRSNSARPRTLSSRSRVSGRCRTSRSDRFPRLSVDCTSCKAVAVENHEYNSFPSKRIKKDSVFQRRPIEDPSPAEDMDHLVAELDRYSVIVHEVLFAKGWGDLWRTETKGWGSFELAVKTVLQNLTILVKNRHAQEIQSKMIKV